MLRTRLKWQPAMVLGATVAAVTLFGSGTAPAQQPAAPRATKLRIAFNGFENNITPFSVTFAAIPVTNDLMHLVYDSLFWSQVKTDPEPWLAQKAEPSNNSKVWTVTLKPGIKWQDGVPLTAEDIKFSFEYYRKHEADSGRYAHHVAQPPFDRAEVVNPRVVKLYYREPAPTFKILPGADLPIIPKHIWSKISDPRTAAKMLPVGSGPYKVTKIVSDQRYVLKANPTYFKGKPTVDELDLSIVTDPNAAFQALRAGQVDAVTRDVPPELVDSLGKANGIKVVSGTRFDSVAINFNARKKPWTDPVVRKAISLATDENALVKRVLLGQAIPGNDSFVHPQSPWALPGGGHEYDPAKAKATLEKAGYRASKPGGVRRTPDGKPLVLKVLVPSTDPIQQRAMQLVATQVASVGIKVQPEVLDPATLRDRRNAPPGKVPTYDAYISGLETHAHVDPDGLFYFFHSPGDKGFGAAITGWSNKRFDQLVEAAGTKGPQQRKPLLHQAEKILAAQAPIITLWYPKSHYAYRPAAYAGWVSDLGEGIFNPRSFLKPYVLATKRTASTTSGDSGGTSAAVWIVLAVVLLGLIAGIGVLRRRRTGPEGDW